MTRPRTDHPTLARVAREAGVAKSTASLAFSDPERVGEATRERVLAIARELGYAPNALAKSLKTGRNDLLGLIVSDMRSPHGGNTQDAIQARAYARGHLLIVGTSRDDAASERELLERFAALRIRGVLLTATGLDVDYAALLDALRIDVVTLDQHLVDSGRDHVGLDNARATRLLVRHLVGLGHRVVAHVGGRRGLWTAEERLAGVRAGLAEAGLALADEHLVDGDFREERAHAATLALMRGANAPSAIVAANDATALGARRAIRELGLDCPRDVSLVCVDDLPGGALVEPRMTHVEQPLEAICHRATDLLIDRLEGLRERPEEPVHEAFEPTLVVGDSSGPPPAVR